MGIYASRFKAAHSEYIRVTLDSQNGIVYGNQVVSTHRRHWAVFTNGDVQFSIVGDQLLVTSPGGTVEIEDHIFTYGEYQYTFPRSDFDFLIPQEIVRIDRADLVFGPGRIQMTDGQLIFIYPRFQYLFLGTEVTQNYLPVSVQPNSLVSSQI